MREAYPEISRRRTEVLALAPHPVDELTRYWRQAEIPFPGLADPERTVFARYDVRSAVLSLGQRPGLFVIDTGGIVRFVHHGRQQWEIPTMGELFDVLERLA